VISSPDLLFLLPLGCFDIVALGHHSGHEEDQTDLLAPRKA